MCELVRFGLVHGASESNRFVNCNRRVFAFHPHEIELPENEVADCFARAFTDDDVDAILFREPCGYRRVRL